MFGKHFLSLSDYSQDEVYRILETAKLLKSQQKQGISHHLLKGKSLALIFQKPSNRTRVSFSVGMYQLGGQPLPIQPNEIQMGKREPIADVSRVMSRYVHAVMMRVLLHTELVEFAAHSSVPVINGLSDLFHPCQAVSDMLTIEEHKGRLKDIRLCYVGDGNNVCNSLIYMSNRVGMKMIVCCPENHDPLIDPADVPYEIIREPQDAVTGADVVYTDVWTSMGQEDEKASRLRTFETYTITESLMKKAADDVIFMHCLPAHRGEEVEAGVVDGPHSVVYDQAENRMHAQKAVLALLLCEEI